ncbi:MAG: hypothetical protein WB710_01015 [Stellaceae bacterium]
MALGLDMADGLLIRGRVAIGCAYRAPLAAKLALERALAPGELAQQAAALAKSIVNESLDPVTDHQASADYRREWSRSCCNAIWPPFSERAGRDRGEGQPKHVAHLAHRGTLSSHRPLPWQKPKERTLSGPAETPPIRAFAAFLK